ncbi:MAG: selenocysteine-specific translation elongation factor [Microbacteriaceae bacterium]|nr:selenocysteine-specific translation elongation factor [Microbacteriaceae bacterium]
MTRSFVVATSGHVDHGKSTLVRALTGIEPDRWDEERRRGLTIDLGFAWTDLPSGRRLAFVDVPGHERFLGNMLAGLGPAPVVLFVVAADQGWQPQSSDHLAAAAALGIRHGVVALARTDLASAEQLAAASAEIRERLAPTGLAAAPIVPVSARTGAGLDALRAALDDVLATVPPADDAAPVRLWIDRSFSIAGAGTVVTGTLSAGRIARGDAFELGDGHRVEVRGIQSRGERLDEAVGVQRVALNLRGIPVEAAGRGDALLSPGAWHRTATVDARRVSGAALDDLPEQLIVHVGSAAVPAHLRPFGPDHVRLRLERPLPLRLGDRMVLRDPGGRSVVGGVQLLDVDPPVLRRRGAGTRRAAELERLDPAGDLAHEVSRRGAAPADALARLGLAVDDPLPDGLLRVGDWLVAKPALADWARRLRTAVTADAERDPLSPGLTRDAAVDALRLPDARLAGAVVRLARLEVVAGRIRMPGAAASLGAAERGVAELERRLGERPFAAPEADDLAALRLGPKELAAAERVGRLVRIADGVVLRPDAPARAARELARLPQPFTASEARQALGTTRRVAIPLLELLDRRGLTRRLPDTRREVVRD